MFHVLALLQSKYWVSLSMNGTKLSGQSAGFDVVVVDVAAVESSPRIPFNKSVLIDANSLLTVDLGVA